MGLCVGTTRCRPGLGVEQCIVTILLISSMLLCRGAEPSSCMPSVWSCARVPSSPSPLPSWRVDRVYDSSVYGYHGSPDGTCPCGTWPRSKGPRISRENVCTGTLCAAPSCACCACAGPDPCRSRRCRCSLRACTCASRPSEPCACAGPDPCRSRCTTLVGGGWPRVARALAPQGAGSAGASVLEGSGRGQLVAQPREIGESGPRSASRRCGIPVRRARSALVHGLGEIIALHSRSRVLR